ncbi:hypothetical protein V6Z11_A09G171000 [Gossypium hirsutum]
MRSTLELKNPFGFRPLIFGGGFLGRPRCWKIEHRVVEGSGCAGGRQLVVA